MLPETTMMMEFIDSVLDHGYFYGVISGYEVRYGPEYKWEYRRERGEAFTKFTPAHLSWLTRKDQFDIQYFDQLLLQTIGSAIALKEYQLEKARKLLGPELYDSQLDLWKAFERSLVDTINSLINKPKIRKVEDLDEV